MTKCPDVVRVDPALLSDDDLIVRIAAVADQRVYLIHEHTAPSFSKSGWFEHEQELIEAATERGIDGDIQPAIQMGWRAWYAKRTEDRNDQKAFDFEQHLIDHPIDDPYRRPYPQSSWAYFDGAWHALVADALDIFEADHAGRRYWRGEDHLVGCHRPDHPYYQRRRDAIDEVRALPGHRPR